MLLAARGLARGFSGIRPALVGTWQQTAVLDAADYSTKAGKKGGVRRGKGGGKVRNLSTPCFLKYASGGS